jgi:hypothetical protein
VVEGDGEVDVLSEGCVGKMFGGLVVRIVNRLIVNGFCLVCVCCFICSYLE